MTEFGVDSTLFGHKPIIITDQHGYNLKDTTSTTTTSTVTTTTTSTITTTTTTSS